MRKLRPYDEGKNENEVQNVRDSQPISSNENAKNDRARERLRISRHEVKRILACERRDSIKIHKVRWAEIPGRDWVPD